MRDEAMIRAIFLKKISEDSSFSEIMDLSYNNIHSYIRGKSIDKIFQDNVKFNFINYQTENYKYLGIGYEDNLIALGALKLQLDRDFNNKKILFSTYTRLISRYVNKYEMSEYNHEIKEILDKQIGTLYYLINIILIREINKLTLSVDHNIYEDVYSIKKDLHLDRQEKSLLDYFKRNKIER